MIKTKVIINGNEITAKVEKSDGGTLWFCHPECKWLLPVLGGCAVGVKALAPCGFSYFARDECRDAARRLKNEKQKD